jgi:predicted lipoprotein with Yx(FWY)xxD motif
MYLHIHTTTDVTAPLSVWDGIATTLAQSDGGIARKVLGRHIAARVQTEREEIIATNKGGRLYTWDDQRAMTIADVSPGVKDMVMAAYEQGRR